MSVEPRAGAAAAACQPCADPAPVRAPYAAPRLEALGKWTALTLAGSAGSGSVGDEPISSVFDPRLLGRLG